MLGGMLGSIGVSAVKSAHEKYKKHKKRKEWRRKYEENDDIYEEEEYDDDDGDDDGIYDGEENDEETQGITDALGDDSLDIPEQSFIRGNMEINSETKTETITPIGNTEDNENDLFPMPTMNIVTNAQGAAQMGQPQFGEGHTNGNSDAPPPSYNDVIKYPYKYSTGEQSVSGYQQQPKYPIAGMPESGVNYKAPWQSAGQTFQDLINNRDAIEKEINDIEEKINGINNDIESGKINATEGAAKVKSLMAEAKMKEKRLKRLQQQVIQQQGAMPLYQNMWQAQPGMMYAPQSPQGMPLFVSPFWQMMQPKPPISGQEMYYAPQPPGMVVPPQQILGNGANTITEGEGGKVADEVDKAKESKEEEVTKEDTSENDIGESSDSDVKEENTPYSTTHNAIFKDNEVERKSAESLENFRIDDLVSQMEQYFVGYLSGDENEREEETAAYKPYDRIIEKLLVNIEDCKEAYIKSPYLDDPTCLAYKKILCECIQDWDSDIVKAFTEISDIKKRAAKESDSSECYEEARKLMANLLNVIQPNAYVGFYIKSVEEILGKKLDNDDDDNVLSSKHKLFKGDGKKYSISICYVGTARTINNLIEVIKFIRGGDQNVAQVVTDVGDLCSKCIDKGTVIDTSRDNFRNMPSKIQDIKDRKPEVFGSDVSKVNDTAFDESLKTLRKLVEKLNKINKNEEEIAIYRDLEIINSLLCNIPRNTAEHKFQSIKNIMTGILDEGSYDSAKKMFRD